MLNELVGKETLLKCYYHTDFNDLVNKLINITGNTEDAIRLISYGDMIHSLTKIKNNNFMENETNLNNMKEEFVNLFNQYYKALYQKDMLEDPYLSACTDYFFNNNYLNIENYDPQYYEIYDLTKNYLKGEENFTIYTSYNYSNNGVYRKFYIDYDPKEPNLYQDTFNTQVHLIENEFNNNYNMNK